MMHTVAATYGVLGKAQPVLTWLRKASTNGLPVYPVYRDNPHFECMRSQPQFLRFMATSKKSGHLSSESLEVQFASTSLKWNCGERRKYTPSRLAQGENGLGLYSRERARRLTRKGCRVSHAAHH
jgi:hypothetical protein